MPLAKFSNLDFARPAAYHLGMPRVVVCGFVVLVALLAVAAPKPERSWQKGIVLESERVRRLVGFETASSTQHHGSTSQTVGDLDPTYASCQRYVIEGEKYIYVAEQPLRWRWSRPARLTVNGPVRFAIDGKWIYVLDDEGKERRAEIVKRILKQPAKETK